MYRRMLFFLWRQVYVKSLFLERHSPIYTVDLVPDRRVWLLPSMLLRYMLNESVLTPIDTPRRGLDATEDALVIVLPIVDSR